MGTDLILISYLHIVGKVGAVGWEATAGSTGSVVAGGSHVPWPREEGLARCREDELWPPRVFAIVVA